MTALKKGGLPARRHRNVALQMAQGSAVLMPMVVGLEASGWRLSRFRGSELLELACEASREAHQVVGGYHGVRPPCGDG